MSFDFDKQDPVEQAISACKTVQFMIDFSTKQLIGLRTQCATTEQITQKEIKDTESKLVKLFSDQLVAKARLATDVVPEQLGEYPKTEQWLRVVGIADEAVELSIKQIPLHSKNVVAILDVTMATGVPGIMERGITLDSLLEMSENDVEGLMSRYQGDSDDTRRLNLALKNLKNCTEIQLQGQEDREEDWHFTDLFGLTSTKSASNSPCNGNSPKFHQRPSTASLPTESLISSPHPVENPASPQSTPSSPLPTLHFKDKYTPPPTPPPGGRHGGKTKFRGTPPPIHRQKLLQFPETVTITKSKSHESQLANRVIEIDPVKSNKKKTQNSLGGSHEALYMRRLSTEGGSDSGATGRGGQSGHTSPVVSSSSPIRSPPYKHESTQLPDEYTNKYSNTLTVPKSPKTPLTIGPKMKHQINHRFTNTFKLTSCDVCHKQMFLGYKCKDCKFTSSFVFAPCDICSAIILRGKVCKYCKKKFHRDCASKARPTCGLTDDYVDAILHLTGPDPLPDSSSNTSSCNSSTPSSPALISSGTVTSPSPAPSPVPTQFKFPDITASLPIDFTMSENPSLPNDDVVNTNTSNDSDKTLVDSTGNPMDRIQLDRVGSVDSQDDSLGHSWNRQNSLSVAMKEWAIPYEELIFIESIGRGRLGTVYRGQWHGDVAVKLLDMGDESDNQAQLAAFKLEIALLRKTRHENLVLFMGACMKPPRLAIVTSYCKGETLYSIIHTKREVFKLNKAMIVASQVAQGMGYLHAKGIVHKDLRSKNIFLDSGKVVIADFGLFNVTKICRGNRKEDWLRVPPGWLCYLGPEVVRALHARQTPNTELPFTVKSDIYAFGTIWYELLCCEWPFKNHPPETIIWQVGRGMKQSLNSLNSPREVKDILMSCWQFKFADRPDFSQIMKALDRIPKNRLIRSPSHPVQLSRSTEVIFNA